MNPRVILLKLLFVLGPLLTIANDSMGQTLVTTGDLEERTVTVFKMPNNKIDSSNAKKAESLAKSFFAALILNKETVLEMADFPFAWDKRAIFENKEQMKKEVLSPSRKADRNTDDERAHAILSITTKTVARQCEIFDYLLPVDIYIVRATIKDKNNREHGAGIAVKMYPKPSVIGFSD